MNPQRFRRSGVFAILLALMVVPGENAWPCSCIGPSGKDALPAAAAMFTGKAMRVEYLEPDEPKVEPKILVTFEVAEVWKGPVQRTLRLRTSYNKWTCDGYYFKQGQSYLVAAHEVKTKGGEVELGGVDICGGTAELSLAGDALKTLGPGAIPPEKAKPQTDGAAEQRHEADGGCDGRFPGCEAVPRRGGSCRASGGDFQAVRLPVRNELS